MGNRKVLPLALIVSVRRHVLTVRHCVRSSLIVPVSVVVVLLPPVVGVEVPDCRVAPGGIAAPFAREKERVDSPVFHHVKLAVRCGHAEGTGECFEACVENGWLSRC